MQPILQDFTIGFFDSSGVFSVYTKKNDVGRALRFHLYDNAHDYTELLSDTGIIISLRVVLPDGFNLPDVPVDRSNVNIEEQSVTVPITAEMVQQSGTARCELVFASSTHDNVLSTTHFKLIVVNSFNTKESVTDPLFNTWTELYIEIRSLEHDYEEHEAIRVENENTRVSNENTRIANENVRISNETTRESNETARVTAETARDAAEQQREAAERIRESRVQEQVDEAHMWADGMNTTEDRPSATNNAKFWAEQARAMSGIFNGTVADWNSLSLADKAKYQTVILTDD